LVFFQGGFKIFSKGGKKGVEKKLLGGGGFEKNQGVFFFGGLGIFL